MGYDTTFSGKVQVTPPLNAAEVAGLRRFADERHNDPSAPSYYCQWVPTDDGTAIEWDGEEKFYGSLEWMTHLIDSFLRPGATAQGEPGFEGFTFDHTVNGIIEATGEERGDIWALVVSNNAVSKSTYTITAAPDADDTIDGVVVDDSFQPRALPAGRD